MLKQAVFALALLLALPLVAEDSTQTVHFARGTSSSKTKGTLKGYDGVRYLLGAKAGQTLAVDLKGSTFAYFNVYAPGSTPGTDEAIYKSDSDGNSASIKLTADGSYTVQVFLYRNEARRNRANPYSLTLGVK